MSRFSVRGNHVSAKRLAKGLQLIELVDLVHAEAPYGGFPALLHGQLLRGVRDLLPRPALGRGYLVGLSLGRRPSCRQPLGGVTPASAKSFLLK